MFVAQTELERLNLTRTTAEVLARKIQDVETKLRIADEITLDPAGRIATDGAALDAAPEYAAMYQSLMTTGTIPGLPASMAGPPWRSQQAQRGRSTPTSSEQSRSERLREVRPDHGRHRAVLQPGRRDHHGGPAAVVAGMYPFIQSTDLSRRRVAAPTDVLPGSEKFVDYSDFRYNRSQTFIGSTTWLDVANWSGRSRRSCRQSGSRTSPRNPSPTAR